MRACEVGPVAALSRSGARWGQRPEAVLRPLPLLPVRRARSPPPRLVPEMVAQSGGRPGADPNALDSAGRKIHRDTYNICHNAFLISFHPGLGGLAREGPQSSLSSVPERSAH